MQDFRTVLAWQKSYALTIRTYALTADFPHSEVFRHNPLASSCRSHPTQRIAEPCGRDTQSEKLRALGAPRVELEYLILLARDLHLIEAPRNDTLHAEVIDTRRTLSGFIKAIDRGTSPVLLLS